VVLLYVLSKGFERQGLAPFTPRLSRIAVVPLEAGKTYRLTVPKDVPAKRSGL
jgi:hypothetical protein